MTGIHISIRLDLPNSNQIGPAEIALLEAIRVKGSIRAAARHLGMAYRTAWLWSSRSMKQCENLLSLPQPADNMAAARR
jgi:molybdenum-dependent DNA-binding transcriptional regulator ModE